MKLRVEIDDDDAQRIAVLLALTKNGAFNSHGPLDMKRLVKMLLEDVALAVRRPDSWEGSNMRQVLRSHGYEV